MSADDMRGLRRPAAVASAIATIMEIYAQDLEAEGREVPAAVAYMRGLVGADPSPALLRDIACDLLWLAVADSGDDHKLARKVLAIEAHPLRTAAEGSDVVDVPWLPDVP